MKSLICIVLFCLAFASRIAVAAEVAAAEAKPPAEPKVSLTAKDTKITELLDSLAKQSKQRFVVETLAKGTITLSLTDVSLESALDSVCKSAKLDWRKVCISPDSKLLEQPDRFAATVRLVSGFSYPDMVVAGASNGRVGVHCSDKTAVKKAEDTQAKDLGMTTVYLISNDAAAAANALSKEKDKAKSEAVDKYINTSKQLIDDFMKMAPEEQEQAIIAALGMADQVGPEYMSSVMRCLMRGDPEVWKGHMAKQSQLLFHMDGEDRRAMLKFNMQAGSMFTPEQQKILQEDIKQITEEMKAESGGQH